MNFRFAHRGQRAAAARQAVAPRRLRWRSRPSFFASPCLAACGRPAGRVQVVSVDERLDIELSDGRIVRLGGLDAPNADHGAPETANNARAFLGDRLVGREVDLIQFAGGTDRWGRTVADLVVAIPETDQPARPRRRC